MMRDDVIWTVSILLLSGVVLQAEGVSAGDGKVVKSGETLLDGADAFDTAYKFVSLVGVEAAMSAARGNDAGQKASTERLAQAAGALI